MMVWEEEVDLWCGNFQMNPKFGSSHHEGVEDIVSISNPAHCKSTKRPIMLLEENIRD